MLDERLEDMGGEEPELTADGSDVAGDEVAAAEVVEREPVVSPFGGDDQPVSAEVEAPGDEPVAEEDSSGGEPDSVLPELPANPKLKWYVVHTYSGHENKVRTNLLRRIEVEDLFDKFGQVLVPTEEVTEMKQGKKTVSSRKYFPSYLLVEMEMCDQAYHLVNQISGVTRFVGLDPRDNSTRPVPLRPNEVDRILGRIARPTETKVTEIPYGVGDHVRVIDGPFSDFNGVVDDVNVERGTLKVMVTIFGRETPVELDFLQVEPV